MMMVVVVMVVVMVVVFVVWWWLWCGSGDGVDDGGCVCGVVVFVVW